MDGLFNNGNNEHGAPDVHGRARPWQHVNDFDNLNDENFKARYRLTKPAVALVLEIIQHGLEVPHHRELQIPPMIQLLVALRFYATGSFLITVGDCLGVCKQSAWTIVHRVSPLIAALRADYIRLPSTQEEIRRTQAELFARSGFPRVIGCVDGRQVRVQSFGGDLAELFRNRHSYFSINVQGTCNSRLEFIDFVARWPGSTHDSTVFDNSRMRQAFEQGQFGDSLLVGDSGYPSELPFLMTPLRDPYTPEEHLYNEAQIRTRNCIERAFGVWARRWAVVSIGSRFRIVERTLPVIVATAVLHNIALMTDPFVYPYVDLEAYDEIRANVAMGAGNTVRERLLNGYFQQLI